MLCWPGQGTPEIKGFPGEGEHRVESMEVSTVRALPELPEQVLG